MYMYMYGISDLTCDRIMNGMPYKMEMFCIAWVIESLTKLNKERRKEKRKKETKASYIYDEN